VAPSNGGNFLPYRHGARCFLDHQSGLIAHTVEHQALHLSRTMCLFYLWTSSTTQRYRPDRWSCWAFHNTGPPMRDGLKGESEGAAGNLSQNSGAGPVPLP